MTTRSLVIATRRSPLAVAQSQMIADALRIHGHTVELRTFVTTGDRWSASGSAQLADKGMFVKELQQALLDGAADLAVHSAKDLPGELPDELDVLAVPAREDARDVLVGVPGGISGLVAGMRVGTGSPRRQAQLCAVAPDVEVIPIRGNIDTRLSRVAPDDLDAVVLAAAGIARLGVEPAHLHPIPVDVSTPAPGQGFLALEGRRDNDQVREALAALADPVAKECLDAERLALDLLGGGCLSPIGAHCAKTDAGFTMTVFVAGDADGTAARRSTATAARATDAAQQAVTQAKGDQ